jgi:N-acetylglucosaminyldiphosphoundecaprenol N-acetyl-beta-D-mannosaminyltransferase
MNHLPTQELIKFDREASMKTVNILNVPIHNLSRTDLLESLQAGGIVFTPNVDHLMKLQKDEEFYRIYDQATYKVCDSQILIYASKFLGTPLKEKISGSDFFPAFYKHYKGNPDMRIFLLGAAEGVAKKAQERINRQVERNIIVDAFSPSFGFENNEQECQQIIDKIRKSGATVLAVGVGAPKQEKWIVKYKEQLPNIKIFLAVGATLDFEAGQKERAPEWMSLVGLEWLYRLFSEPKRMWKRYIVEDLPFFWLIMQQKLNLYKMPFTKNFSSTSWNKVTLGTKV